ncbi:ADP compounds hydrolase NudE [Catenovulum sp. SM1970]|uniref:ADP compounds hydrolase NudE n=1 Tax=Marinifaba aquimaris TaxID=2741323 RepID=UPI0015748865|nr:ADP compounds hydrolase NudE [Marinifaba aquimaris]NTS76539.1 ADP compounds hydrolase NudE [Marinifaba aquimaris]
MTQSTKKTELPKILSTNSVAKSRLFEVESVELEFSNGNQRTYERMKSSGRSAVMVIPMLDDETMLLVREYAGGTHTYELGFPKGLIDPDEQPEQAANRELKEEIGYGANELISLQSVTMAPSYFSARMHILLAKGLYEERLEGDEPEPLEIVPWPISQVDQLLAQPDFNEARSIAALFLARRHLNLDTPTD